MSAEALRIAVVVDPSLAVGPLANTVSAIGIGLGGALPGLAGTLLTDAGGHAVHTSASRPVTLLQAAPDAMATLLARALPAPGGGVVVPFPRFARGVHRFEDYLAEFTRRTLAGEALDGLGLCGPDRWVRSLTGSLKLLR
ncbi:MAG TPA: DUF2000 domain-containing protein [Burkholderiaceae bacterium]